MVIGASLQPQQASKPPETTKDHPPTHLEPLGLVRELRTRSRCGHVGRTDLTRGRVQKGGACLVGWESFAPASGLMGLMAITKLSSTRTPQSQSHRQHSHPLRRNSHPTISSRSGSRTTGVSEPRPARRLESTCVCILSCLLLLCDAGRAQGSAERRAHVDHTHTRVHTPTTANNTAWGETPRPNRIPAGRTRTRPQPFSRLPAPRPNAGLSPPVWRWASRSLQLWSFSHPRRSRSPHGACVAIMYIWAVLALSILSIARVNV